MTAPDAPFGIGVGDVLAFHRVRGSDETWTLVAGGPLELHLIHPDGCHETRRLAPGSDRSARATTIDAGSLRAARLAPGAVPALVRRAVGSGKRAFRIEFPSSEEILRRHPLHRAIVLALTRG